MKILFVDDELNILKGLERAFRKFKGEVTTQSANSVQEACKILEGNEIDCIVSDLNMPIESGLGLISYIQKNDLNIPVIIMTGEPKIDSAVQCMKTGAADYITKPIDADSLMKKLWDLTKCVRPWNRGYIIKDYYLIENIAETYSSIVFLSGKFDDNKNYAIKDLRRDEMVINELSIERFNREVNLLSSIEHENIVKIIDYGITEHGIPYYVMPFISGNDLAKSITDLPLNNFIKYMLDICEAINFLHKKNIIHRDLKPHNIIIENGKAILIDYGTILTPESDLTQDNSLLGTPNYMAPECFTDSHHINYQADYFSLGAIIYLYAYGKTPYSGKNIYEILNQIINTDDNTIYKGSIFDSLLRKLLIKSAKLRYNNIESIKKDLIEIKNKS